MLVSFVQENQQDVLVHQTQWGRAVEHLDIGVTL